MQISQISSKKELIHKINAKYLHMSLFLVLLDMGCRWKGMHL